MLYVATAPGRAETLATIAGVSAANFAESTSRDVMLSEIKFDHPLFAPLAGPSSTTSPRSISGSIELIKPESLGGLQSSCQI